MKTNNGYDENAPQTGTRTDPGIPSDENTAANDPALPVTQPGGEDVGDEQAESGSDE